MRRQRYVLTICAVSPYNVSGRIPVTKFRDLSHLRIKVEYAFRISRGTFPVLRALGAHSDLEFCGGTTCVTQLLTENGDDSHKIEGFNGKEDGDTVRADVREDNWARGRTRRLEGRHLS
jgi:hypothetical protein